MGTWMWLQSVEVAIVTHSWQLETWGAVLSRAGGKSECWSVPWSHLQDEIDDMFVHLLRVAHTMWIWDIEVTRSHHISPYARKCIAILDTKILQNYSKSSVIATNPEAKPPCTLQGDREDFGKGRWISWGLSVSPWLYLYTHDPMKHTELPPRNVT